MKKPELLAPAGSMESLKAAICAGCDAVYLSGKKYGARSFATNFDNDELIEAIKLCHLYGIKISLLFLKIFKKDFSHGTTSPVMRAQVVSNIRSIIFPSFLPSHKLTTSFARKSQKDNSILSPNYKTLFLLYMLKFFLK